MSGWGFKEEFNAAAVKIEKEEDDCEPMESGVEGYWRIFMLLFWSETKRIYVAVFNQQPVSSILLQARCQHTCPLITPMNFPLVKQEPEETEIKKTEGTFRPPPLPEPDVLHDLLHSWSLSKGEELFFIQLPDSLPGQPPTKEHRPVKTEVQSEDGQSVLLKTEDQVVTAFICILKHDSMEAVRTRPCF